MLGVGTFENPECTAKGKTKIRKSGGTRNTIPPGNLASRNAGYPPVTFFVSHFHWSSPWRHREEQWQK